MVAAAARTAAKVYWFSLQGPVGKGAWVEGDKEGRKDAESLAFRASGDGPVEVILPLKDIPLKGVHNIENVLAAVCAARLAGVPAEAIARAVAAFHAVEHRLEYVTTDNASSSITTLRPPTSMPRRRQSRRFRDVFISSSAAKIRTPITRTFLTCCASA